VVLAIIIALRSWSTDIYAITPGNATDVTPLVSISGLTTDPNPDRILLVDVYLQPLSELQYLWMDAFDSHVEFVTEDELLSPGIPSSQLTDQGFLEMSDSQNFAKVAALRALGWTVPATPSGAVVTAVASATPAARAGLNVGDEITAVDGNAVRSECGLLASLVHVAAKTTVHLTVVRGTFSSSGVLRHGATSTITVVTAASPNPGAATGCANAPHAGPSYIGVVPEDGVSYQFPGKISVNTANIGGPSAGLAMTLTMIDKLSRGSLTGGHAISATGTIDPSGDVGAIGGVAEKTIAVEDAGVHYFFVPQANLAAAQKVADPSLHLIGVTKLSQVLTDLRKIGGAAPVAFTRPR
jgi:PDZ domain-containing protein